MAAQQQGGGGSDNSLGFLWILVSIFVFALLMWFVGHKQIVQVFFAFKSFEIAIISIFTSGLDNIQQAINSADPASVTFMQLANVADAVGNYYKYPIGLMLIVMAGILYSTSAKTAFQKIYSMSRLRDQEKENWPQITPVGHLDLVNTDIDEGPWSMAETPMQFAKKYRLIKLDKQPLAEGELERDRRTLFKIIRSKANQAFVKQLGRSFQGVDKMPIHYQALFAIFAARANADTKAAEQMILQIAGSASESGKLNFSGVDALLQKHLDSKVVKKVLVNHAFELTVMATMLGIARMDGVVATAEFLWLKPVDRPLWYMLNTVGRRVAPPEIAGPHAHWLAEKAIGRKLSVPMIDEATTALQDALNDILYDPDQKYE